MEMEYKPGTGIGGRPLVEINSGPMQTHGTGPVLSGETPIFEDGVASF